MAIRKPMLPPKSGYVEVEINGIRTYKNIKTGILINDEILTLTPEERIVELETQLAESDEAAIALYEAQMAQGTIDAEQDEAILELYELLGG